MANYSYIARDPATGGKVKGQIEADSEQHAAKLVRGQGLTPIEVSIAGTDNAIAKFFKRVKPKDRVLFSRQLATLINAGLPLLQSLRTVSGQTQNKNLKVIIDKIVNDIESGMSFSVAIAKHPDVFNQIYVSLVEAGEASGTLDAALERIAFQQEKDAEIAAKVKGAMVYPIIVLLVMFGVLGFMLTAVLPQVKVMYEGMQGAQLPFITVVLLAISDFIIAYWPYVLALLVFIGFMISRWAKTTAGSRMFDRMKMRMPPIGGLFMKVYMARFARTGTTLIGSGVPLIQVLEITARAINNVYLSESIIAAIDKVRSGKALSEAIAKDPNFLSLVPDMLRIGEQSGSIEDMMAKTADYYEKEVDDQIKTISTIIEPVLMVALGIVAFIIVAAVLLPIYGLAGQSMI